MTERERFLATMRYEPRDRCPIMDFSFWDETLPEWHKQGLPEHVVNANSDEYFGMDSMGESPPLHNGLFPAFEWRVLEDLGDEEIVRDWVGVTFRWQKSMKSIPLYLDHTLKGRDTWESDFKGRLNPDDPDRIPPELPEVIARLNRPEQERLVTVHVGSLYGWIRDWMGVEEASYLVYDDPELFEEMVETITQIQEVVLAKAFALGLKADCANMWEDMCYSGGPLLTPSIFNRVLVPRYRRIMDVLRKNGVDLCWTDCDGKIDELIPGWLEAGINIMFPIEVGTWGADPVKFRKEYGRDLRMMGGFDKHILAQSKESITREVERFAPLVEEGGFIPFPDHRVPPDVPYEHYRHYLREIRRVWGKGVNLLPCPALEEDRA